MPTASHGPEGKEKNLSNNRSNTICEEASAFYCSSEEYGGQGELGKISQPVSHLSRQHHHQQKCSTTLNPFRWQVVMNNKDQNPSHSPMFPFKSFTETKKCAKHGIVSQSHAKEDLSHNRWASVECDDEDFHTILRPHFPQNDQRWGYPTKELTPKSPMITEPLVVHHERGRLFDVSPTPPRRKKSIAFFELATSKAILLQEL
ncbi:hypothetical protein IV203_011439 [Nitzschia inconspicua]|uniref:Uncharacterized protein n=1 Tax=Nitzschia inconspicua TaxID=303405 RepID=A0A9K3KSC5_9STRA|nr:hypothetical protein IV203_011439 [Nitzschia inconspicua]